MKRRQLLVSMSAAMAALWLPVAASAQKAELIFVPLPLENAEKTFATWQPILEYLNSKLNFKLTPRFIEKYSEIQAEHAAGKVDLVIYGPLPYVQARENAAHLEPFVVFHEASGQPTYRCALIGKSKETLAEVRSGKTPLRVALTQPQSTCGFLSAEYLLQQEGLSLRSAKFRYVGRHDAVGEAVAAGEFPLGGLSESIGKRFESLGAVILKTTEPIPGFAMVANTKNVTADQMKAIQKALAEAPAEVRDKWGNYRYGVSPASDADYASFRKLTRLVFAGGPIPQESSDN